jgi:WD40 repeat protein
MGCKDGKGTAHFDAPFGTKPVEKLSPDGRKVLVGSGDGTMKLWDVETGKELASLYGFQDGSWAVVDPEGRFDADKIEGNVALHWVVDNDPMRVLPLATLKDKLLHAGPAQAHPQWRKAATDAIDSRNADPA